ncbi:hypothetical protein AWM68_06725 [Fictibacillus phosphorivorans]|uniref:SGNH hydrolase-type esterase domain-containing protein n=1 Tax=Fictibacillus phosphorivorans TaxID=1221500 RepID=A0A163R1R9_9BACL|nr:GDSL-type esterase/lipase family protein [Fictibacillus phosphorivorans]KZE66064.1 hypothetical protein AWM68_06725 [Fictibacillus phosphorivorans]
MYAEYNASYDWLLTAIGDSLTVGVGAPVFGKGYVGRYVGFTQDIFNKKIFVNNFAVTGTTSEEILTSLKDNEVRNSIKKSKIILITAGGNDLIQAAFKYMLTHKEEPLYRALENCKRNLKKIFKVIFKLKKNDKEPFIIRICTLYNPYFKWSKAIEWVNLFNNHIKSYESLPNVRVADLYQVFKGREKELVSFDSVHPNKNGYQVIAVSLFELGFKEIE